MHSLEKNREILQVLQTASPKLRKAIIENADDKVICVLVEIINNLLSGNIPLSTANKIKLRRWKTTFRKLCQTCINKKGVKIKPAREQLIQTGGALPFLIPLLAPIIAKAALGGIAAAASGAITKKIIEG